MEIEVFSQRIVTQNFVSHSSNTSWSTNTWYKLDDISQVVQEIVNRSDWQSGNSLSLIIKGTGGNWARKFIRSFKNRILKLVFAEYGHKVV